MSRLKQLIALSLFLGLIVAQIPAGFVEIREVAPSIILDLRYYSSHNFTGTRIQGYNQPKCYLTVPAAEALRRVQAELIKDSLSLKIYDGYRPQRAVDHFVAWARILSDTLMKREFYPNVDKANLFSAGYIASRSSHSRGSTVDVTLVRLPVRPQEDYSPDKDLCDCTRPRGERFGDNSIDMGTGYDCFHEWSWTASLFVGAEQQANRMLLKKVMEKHGFRNYDREWWHYTLSREPFPETYFDFAIE